VEIKKVKAVSFKLYVKVIMEFVEDTGSLKFKIGGGSDINS